MKRLSMILIAAAIVIPLVGPTLEGQQRFPEILYSSDPDIHFPAWVSAAAAIDSHGVVNEKLFPAPLRSTIESYFAEPIEGYWSKPKTGGCYHVEEYFVSQIDPPDRSSLDRAAKNSGFVFIGRITGATYGFHFDVPGQLFRIEPDQVLHGEAFLDFYYIFYPVGEFSAGPYRICKSDSRYPKPPKIGDELLIMVPETRTRSSADAFLELDEASSIVVIPEEGELRLPSVFKDSAKQESTPLVKNKTEIVAAVRKALSKKEGLP